MFTKGLILQHDNLLFDMKESDRNICRLYRVLFQEGEISHEVLLYEGPRPPQYLIDRYVAELSNKERLLWVDRKSASFKYN